MKEFAGGYIKTSEGIVKDRGGANFKPALRELSDRSERIVEFARGDEATLGALRDVASADESPAQRAMLLKRGLIEMVKGQVVITERGYKMMQEAGVPPKLTPAERRKEIAGKREFARGDYLTDNARKFLYTLMPKHRAELAGYKVNIPARGTKEAIEEARQLRHSRKLKPTVNPKPYGNGNWVSVLKHDDNWGKREFARGDFLRQAVGKYSDVAPAVVPGVSPSVIGPRGKEWRSQFLLWARKRAAKPMV